MKHFSHLDSTARTDVGRKRKNNEDASLLLPELGVFCVADGMGGGDDGEFASAAFVEQVQSLFEPYRERLSPLDLSAKTHLVRLAANEACRLVRRRMRERGTSGTGSTAVVLLFDAADPAHAVALHAGDSRVYRSRAGRLTQVTNDHSVGSAVGIRNEEDLPAMFRGVVTRGIGLDETVELEQTEVDVAEGDLFLICSDGLNRMVTDREIRGRLRAMRGQLLDHVALSLIDDALEAGGKDNVTVLLVRVGPLPDPEVVENPLFETKKGSGVPGGGAAPTTVTDASPTPAPPSDGSGTDGSTDHGLPDDQLCIEGTSAGRATATGSGVSTGAMPEGTSAGPEEAGGLEGPPELRKGRGGLDRIEDVLAVAELRAGRLERHWKALDREVRLRWLAGVGVVVVLLLCLAARCSLRTPVPEQEPEDHFEDVPPAVTLLFNLAVEGTTNTSTLIKIVDLASGRGTNLDGGAYPLDQGTNVFWWGRPGFERQRHTVVLTGRYYEWERPSDPPEKKTLKPGEPFRLRASRWIASEPPAEAGGQAGQSP